MSGVDGVNRGAQPNPTQGTSDVTGPTPTSDGGSSDDDLIISHYSGGADGTGVADDHDMPAPYLGSSAAIMLMLINMTGQANQKLSSTVADVLKDQNKVQMQQNQQRMDKQAEYNHLSHHHHHHFWEDFAKIVGASLLMGAGAVFGVVTYGAGSEVTVATTMIGTGLIGSVAIADAAGGFDNLPADVRTPLTLSLYALGAAMTLGASLPSILQSLKSFAQAAGEAAVEGGTELGAGAAAGAEEALAEGASTTGIADAEGFAETMTETINAASMAENSEEAANIFVTGLRQALIDGGVDTGQLTEEMQQELTAAIEASLEETGVAGEEIAPAATEEISETSQLGEGVTEADAEVQQPQINQEPEGEETFGMDYQENPVQPRDAFDQLPDVDPKEYVAMSQEQVDALAEEAEGGGTISEEAAEEAAATLKKLPVGDGKEGSELDANLMKYSNYSNRAGKISQSVAQGLHEKNQADILEYKVKMDQKQAELQKIQGESDQTQATIKDTKPYVATYANKVKSVIDDTAEILSNLDDGNYVAAERVGAPPMGAMS
ncbi:MAG: hypothetical protein AAF416_17240 [Pseudomonadota bacterium]